MALANELDHPLNYVCEEWLSKIELAQKVKYDVFGQYAEETAKFYDGPHDWMWKEEYATGMNGFLDKDGSRHLPTFRMTVNKPFEAVALFGPALMHRYPEVMVTPVDHPILPPQTLGLDPNDPMMAEQYQLYLAERNTLSTLRGSHAAMMQHYLNWLQIETEKKVHARRAITEAIVKGLGILWTDLYAPRGSRIRYPRSSFVSVDDIVKDPDAQYNEDVQWIGRRHIQPVNLVARRFGLQIEDLKGHLQSYASQATRKGKKEAKSRKSKETATSYDLIEYWEIYSKNGFGHRLKSTKKTERKRFNFDVLGDFTYIVVAKGIPFPLNFPSWALAESPDEQFERAQWPIPFWTDEGCGNGWPMAELHFYEKMNTIWPLSLIKPAIGELRFINWCMSFLADKAAASATTYVGVAKAAGMEIQNQLQQGLAPYTIIEISDLLGKSIREVVSFLEAPNFSLDVWKMVAEVMDLIDKRTGLTELIYGLTGAQMRSATEADVRNSNLNIRPDDMAERTEDFYSASALKEAEAMVWALEGADVAGVLGDDGAAVFEQQIQTQDFENIVRDYKYRIQAGSARKPNKANRLRSLTEFGQVSKDLMAQFALAGHVEPWNAYISEWAKAMDLDATQFLINLPPPQEQGPSPEEQEHEAELVREEEKHRQSLSHRQDEHEQEMSHDTRKSQLELGFLRKRMASQSNGK